MADVIVRSISPETLQFDNYSVLKQSNLEALNIDTTFNTSSDYIEYYVYDEDNNTVYPNEFDINNPNIYTNWKSINSFVSQSKDTNKGVLDVVELRDVTVNPSEDVELYAGTTFGNYNTKYCFYRKRLGSSPTSRFFISEISSDRTELKLISTQIGPVEIIEQTQDFIEYRINQPYFVDFYLNFGNNILLIANNIALDLQDPTNPTVLIKLVNPLPAEITTDVQLWVVETNSNPFAFNIEFPDILVSSSFSTPLRGPNLSLISDEKSNNSTQPGDKNSLLNNPTSSFTDQLNYLISASNSVDINVNYESFSEYVKFSSALTRLENFNYKAKLIESASNQITTLNNITGSTTASFSYSESIDKENQIITDAINSFTPYEYFLYYDSGSQFSWPKSTNEPPYALYSTGSTQVLNWLGSANPTSSYYGSLALSASNYDNANMDMLYNCLPKYVKDDNQNQPLFLLIDMFGEMYDSIYIYQKAVTDKYNADNRLDFGLSKDLVFKATQDIGVTLYANNFSSDNVYTSLLGVNQDGNYTIPNTTGSLGAALPRGYQYVSQSIYSTNISSSLFPLNDLSKRLYKRIYHNAPYLFKTKGTKESIRTLLNIYGIPETIIQINEFGNKDRDNSNDWDYYKEVYNNALTVTGDGYVEVPWAGMSVPPPYRLPGGYKGNPQAFAFRFKTFGPPDITSSNARFSQSLFMVTSSYSDFSGFGIDLPDPIVGVLEYTGSAGTDSGSYSGSITSSYETWGTIKVGYQQEAGAARAFATGSVFGPYFDGNWHTVLVSLIQTGSLSKPSTQKSGVNLVVKSNIYSGSDGTKIGFQTESGRFQLQGGGGVGNINSWIQTTGSFYLGGKEERTITWNTLGSGDTRTYKTFSGSFQELRYYRDKLIRNQGVGLDEYFTTGPFDDFVMNPRSIEGNSIFSLDSGSNTSISSSISSSFRTSNDSKNIVFFRADLGSEKYD